MIINISLYILYYNFQVNAVVNFNVIFISFINKNSFVIDIFINFSINFIKFFNIISTENYVIFYSNNFNNFTFAAAYMKDYFYVYKIIFKIIIILQKEPLIDIIVVIINQY